MIEAGTGTLQNSWFLLDDVRRVVAKGFYGTFGKILTAVVNGLLASPLIYSATSVAVLVRAASSLSFDSGTLITPTGIARVLLNFNSSRPQVNQQLNDNLFVSAASLTGYDGQEPTETGFLLFPDMVSASVSGVGGTVTAGVHSFTAVYEWVDYQGQRHQSAPAVPYELDTMASTNQITVTIPTLFLSKKPNINIVVFATKAGGSTFYRCNSISQPVANDTTAAAANYTFDMPDSTLEAGELLYTTGDILENISPFPCSFCFVHQNRVFTNNSEDPYGFQYSQPAVPNFGLQWNDSLIGRVDSGRGKLTGGASLDNKAIFFTERGIFVMVGTGPNTTGAFNNYSQSERIPSDVGCTEPLSIVEMPQGIIFKSTKGFYLLDRGLNVQYIGSAVSGYDSVTCTSAVLLADEQEVRFGLLNNVVLAFSYRTGQWSTYSNMQTVDAMWWAPLGEYVFATSDGIIAATDAPTRGNDDAGGITSVIPLSFTTAWIHLQQALHGFQRVWRLILSGDWNGPSFLEVFAAFDDDPGTERIIAQVADTTDLRDTSLGGWELRIHMPVQKCRSVRFRVTDTPQLGSGLGGLSFSSMSMEVGLKRGMNKLKSGQSY